MLNALITLVREQLADGQHWSICIDADGGVQDDAWGYRTAQACIQDALKYKQVLQAEGYDVSMQLVVCA